MQKMAYISKAHFCQKKMDTGETSLGIFTRYYVVVRDTTQSLRAVTLEGGGCH
jgi:hypothetical protein